MTAAITLLNAHGMDLEWFQPLFDYVMCFPITGFTSPAISNLGVRAPHTSVFVYLGNDVSAFHREFSQFGNVMVPYHK